jgi:hypothetical protein
VVPTGLGVPAHFPEPSHLSAVVHGLPVTHEESFGRSVVVHLVELRGLQKLKTQSPVLFGGHFEEEGSATQVLLNPPVILH